MAGAPGAGHRSSETINPAYVEDVCRIVNASPFVTHLPMRLVSFSAEGSRIELDAQRCHLQPFGTVHGGVLATLIDTATFWAAFARAPEGAGLVSVEIKVNYLEPVTEGLLIAQGRSIRAGRTLSYAEASIGTGDGRLVVHGSSTLMTLPDKGFRLEEPKFLPLG
jgi:uncharacterized protein (TIGR00369 family)